MLRKTEYEESTENQWHAQRIRELALKTCIALWYHFAALKLFANYGALIFKVNVVVRVHSRKCLKKVKTARVSFLNDAPNSAQPSLK